MPRNKLPNVEVLEPLDEPIEIVENIGDLVKDSKKQHENPFVEPEQPKAKVEQQLNYNNLTAKKLKELCKQSGYRNYSKLKKCDLIKMLNGEDVTIPEKPKPKKSISIDTDNEEVIPKEKKSIERKPIKKQKKEELKDNLVKEEPLIKDEVEEEVEEVEEEVEEVEEILEEVERETKPIPPPTPKLKRREPILKPPVQKLEPPQPILPPPQPKKKPFAFKNYYTIY